MSLLPSYAGPFTVDPASVGGLRAVEDSGGTASAQQPASGARFALLTKQLLRVRQLGL